MSHGWKRRFANIVPQPRQCRGFRAGWRQAELVRIRRRSAIAGDTMKATIYHNPKCGTSRKTLEILRDSGADVWIHEYLKNPPTASSSSKPVPHARASARATGCGPRSRWRRTRPDRTGRDRRASPRRYGTPPDPDRAPDRRNAEGRSSVPPAGPRARDSIAFLSPAFAGERDHPQDGGGVLGATKDRSTDFDGPPPHESVGRIILPYDSARPSTSAAGLRHRHFPNGRQPRCSRSVLGRAAQSGDLCRSTASMLSRSLRRTIQRGPLTSHSRPRLRRGHRRLRRSVGNLDQCRHRTGDA